MEDSFSFSDCGPYTAVSDHSVLSTLLLIVAVTEYHFTLTLEIEEKSWKQARIIPPLVPSAGSIA
jgi:hypothetical protein